VRVAWGRARFLFRDPFPHPRVKTVHATFTAHGSQGLATSAPRITPGFVISFAFTTAPLPLPGSRLTRNSSGTRQLLDPENVNPLASFPLYAAFPRSEYYDAPDAHALPRWATHLPAWASHVHIDGLYGTM